jgi:nitroimidazol reductase NimA-like FMN-containing flavoprotein (pyridoxamine 5'-phosphate oxidase superfamily)
VSDDKTRIRRLADRAVEDRRQIEAILDEGIVCHAAYMMDGRPVVIPMLFVRAGDRILIHGSNSMGLARAVRAGSPLSVAVTHMDGLVVARSAFNSSANYRSVVIHGLGRILDGDEKAAALDLIVDKLIPGRLADLRPSKRSEISQTSVVELALDEVSAKMRSGDPEDDDDDHHSDVWAGVIPMRLVADEPVAASDLREGIDLPDYLRPHQRSP